MTIRRRLALWYGGILLVSLTVMAGVLHFEWTEQQQRLWHQRQEPEPAWEEVGEIVLYYGVPTALLLLVGTWWLLRKSLAPISALTEAAERIHLDHLNERLPHTGDRDEIGRLTEVFNAMLARLEDSLARVREFTLHASHELKTPLTVMRAGIESALREDRGDAGQRELLTGQLDEIHRLTRIVDGLAFLAKADAGQLPLKREPVCLDELVKDSFGDAQALGRPAGVTVTLVACHEVRLQGDRHRLRQLLLNLADNAIKYNQPQGSVTMSLTARNGTAEFEIANTGPGIPAESLPRVFDRFFRGDPSHNSEVEGCGLGLSIARWIVQAHRGEIRINSQPDQRTVVTVRLPAG